MRIIGATKNRGLGEIVRTFRQMNGRLLWTPEYGGLTDLMGQTNLTFARASSKTFKTQAGRMGTLVSGGWDPSGRIDPVVQNLCPRSEQYATGWTKGAEIATPIDVTATVPPPHGGTSFKIDHNGGTAANQSLSRSGLVIAAASSGAFWLVKRGNTAAFMLTLRDTTVPVNRAAATFTWDANGYPVPSSVTGNTPEITPLDDGWWLIWLSSAAIVSDNTHQTYIYPSGSAAGTSGYTYAAGTQVETGLIAHPYVPTGATAVSTVADNLYATVGLPSLPGYQRTYAIMWQQNYPVTSYPAAYPILLHQMDTTVGSVDQFAIQPAATGMEVGILDDSVSVWGAQVATGAANAGRHVIIVSTLSGGSFGYCNGKVFFSHAGTYSLEGAINRLYMGMGAALVPGVQVRAVSVFERAITVPEAEEVEQLLRNIVP